MIIEKKILLNNNNDLFYVGVEVKYITRKDGRILLQKKNSSKKYFDSGDLSYLIEQDVEKKYSKEKRKEYNDEITFMANVLYIYDRIPFLSYVKQVYLSSKGDAPGDICTIYKKEIDKYIKDNKIQMGKYDIKKSVSPCLFKK